MTIKRNILYFAITGILASLVGSYLVMAHGGHGDEEAEKAKTSRCNERLWKSPPHHLRDLLRRDADGSVQRDAGTCEHGGEEVALIALGGV